MVLGVHTMDLIGVTASACSVRWRSSLWISGEERTSSAASQSPCRAEALHTTNSREVPSMGEFEMKDDHYSLFLRLCISNADESTQCADTRELIPYPKNA